MVVFLPTERKAALLLHAIKLQQICCGFTAAIKKTAAKMLQSFIILIRLPDLSALRRAVKSKPRPRAKILCERSGYTI